MKCQIFVDWLTFSVKRKDPKEVTVDFLGLDPGLFQEEGIDGHWLRVELVMRHKNSAAFVSQAVACESIGRLTAQVINDKFSFIERDDSNITRCTVCAWWLRFVDELESVRLVARCVIQHRVELIDDWVINQVGPEVPPKS